MVAVPQNFFSGVGGSSESLRKHGLHLSMGGARAPEGRAGYLAWS